MDTNLLLIVVALAIICLLIISLVILRKDLSNPLRFISILFEFTKVFFFRITVGKSGINIMKKNNRSEQKNIKT